MDPGRRAGDGRRRAARRHGRSRQRARALIGSRRRDAGGRQRDEVVGFLCYRHSFVERPQLIAAGIVTCALVGRANVIADSGFSSRAIYAPEVAPPVAWGKPAARTEGAHIASADLWHG